MKITTWHMSYCWWFSVYWLLNKVDIHVPVQDTCASKSSNSSSSSLTMPMARLSLYSPPSGWSMCGQELKRKELDGESDVEIGSRIRRENGDKLWWGKGLIWMIPGYGDDDYKGRLLTKVEEEKDALVFEDKWRISTSGTELFRHSVESAPAREYLFNP